MGAVPERLQSVHRGCESGWGRRLLAVGNAVWAGVGVQERLWGRVSAVGRGEGGTPLPLPRGLAVLHEVGPPEVAPTPSLGSPPLSPPPPPLCPGNRTYDIFWRPLRQSSAACSTSHRPAAPPSEWPPSSDTCWGPAMGGLRRSAAARGIRGAPPPRRSAGGSALCSALLPP